VTEEAAARSEGAAAFDLDELERFVGLLKTQDNAITTDPIFMVQERHRQYGMDEAYCEKYCFVHGDDSDHEVNEESDPVRFAAFSADDFGDDDPDFWTRTGYLDTWQNIQPFLTREAAEEFRRREAHNLGETRVYVESGHRNPEWKWLRAMLPALASELRQARSRDEKASKLGDAGRGSAPSLAQLEEHFKDLAGEDCEDEFIFEGRMNLFRDIVAAARRELP
jgi:hypothetical protein